jgi:hypothetical protein
MAAERWDSKQTNVGRALLSAAFEVGFDLVVICSLIMVLDIQGKSKAADKSVRPTRTRAVYA